MYCRGCIEKFSDCPVCGAEARPLTPDPETQANVELYLEAHADTHSIWELEGLSAPASAAEEPRGRANFLLQLGLRALAGGNRAAGRTWLERCRAVLEDAHSSARQKGRESANEDAAQRLEAAPECALATVRGCLGDCARAQGDLEEAIEHYAASAQLLEDAAVAPTQEVCLCAGRC